MKQDSWKNQLILGDNKEVMQELLPALAGQINLIYIDPPFNTGKNRATYSDRWNSINDYLSFLRDRLQLMKQLLADTGSIYVHLDWHVGHYVKVMMDEIFGYENFRNEIVWAYPAASVRTRRFFIRSFDMILFFSKNEGYIFNDDAQIYMEFSERVKKALKKDGKGWYYLRGGSYDGKKLAEKVYVEKKGIFPRDVWGDIPYVRANTLEYQSFDTQKPEALLRRIILASSNESDIVADFFCGSGTTLAVAEKLGRRWVGCDVSEKAIEVSRNRLEKISAHPFLTIIKTKEKN